MTQVVHRMQSERPEPLNPLVEFAGMWNMRLAEDFREFLSARFGKWESIHGRLVVAPAEASDKSWGEAELAHLLQPVARQAGFFVYASLNMAFDPDTWLQPDLNILHLVVKPRLMAAAGVPFYLRVHIQPALRSVEVTQFKLVDGAYREVSRVQDGVFTMTEPFEARFDVRDLLEPSGDESA